MRIRLACAAGLLLPTTVLALGLGPMQTNSSLLEPFEAKIPLVDAKVEELDTLKVGLANRAQFKRAGLEFALVLSDLRFELVQPKAGNDYVRIWSKEPVREPVLDFLLEVNWSNGRLIREFTVLLDPPRYGSTSSSVAPHRPAATARSWPRPTKPSPRDTTPGDTSDHYGPTQAGDTLWAMARGTRSDEVSIQQMMVALLQANPNAFIDANINRLKQGQILRIPDVTALSSRTQTEALAEVRRHNTLWEEYRQHLASSIPQRSLGAEGSQGTALGGEQDGKQSSPGEQARLEVLGAAGSAAEKPQESAAGKDEEEERAGPETGQLVAEESEAVSQDENSHLRERLKQSESLVELMRRQVQLKDDELAALQAKLAQTGTAAPEGIEKPPGETIEEQPEGLPQFAGAEAGEETTVVPTEPQTAVTDAPVPTEPVATEPLAAAPVTPSGESPVAAAPSESEQTAPSGGAEPLVPEPSIEAQQGAETTDEAMAPPAPDSQDMVSTDEAQPAQAPSSASVELGGELGASETPQEGAQVVDSAPIEGSPLIPGGIYSVIGLIAAAGMFAFWVFWRIRAKSQGAKDEEELTVEVPSPLSGVSGFTGADSEEEQGPVAERTLEDIQEQAHDIETVIEEEGARTRFPTEIPAEKDPLEEVNVCIAYERFDEAEQLVKKAIAVQPRRHDYKLRLLEVYYAAGNKGAYERAARELSEAVGGEGSLWDNAIAMWYEMSPERPLFAEKPEEEERHRDEMESQREVLDITSVSEAERWKSESSPERAGLTMASALDFDLGTTQDKEFAPPISARGGPEEEAGEYTDVFDLSSPEDAASEGIVDITAVAERNTDDAQMLDLTVAESTLDAEDILDLTAVDSEKGVDQDMLDLTVADSTANADEILDLTSTGSGYDDEALDFDITGGHQVPEVTEESEDALHLTVPKATFPSAKAPEPQEQVFEITSPTEGSGGQNRSLEIGQETVELPNRNTRAAVAEQEDDGIQTVDLSHYFQKGGAAARGVGDSTGEPDRPESSAQGAVSEAADSDPFVVSVGDENNEVVDAPSETDLGQSDVWIQTLAELDKGGKDVAEAENCGWDAMENENAEREGDAVDVTSAREHRSQEPSWQDPGEVSQEQAPWSAYRDSAEWVQDDAGTASEGITNPAEHGASAPGITEPALFSESETAPEPPSSLAAEAQGAHGQSAAWSEHPELVPVEEELEVANVEQTTMSKTVELPRDYFAVGTANGRDSAAVEKDFVVIADLTAPEEVVVINLADEVGGKTQDLDAIEIQDNARFANTVRLPRAFPAAAGEPSDLDLKLNLAKAYIELGDPKGAREILDEVVHSGNDLQKQDAETLRRQLG